ncbi:hypothetical protein LFAB_07965 [Lactiplantibacillus fabifermentans T30PCM01]|uniref:Uncharacterized protein n=1 Tax=Lactiplantibacillus fabifermentans T30PCM01 TaxID=1400520 RepID=W6T7V2_9LACO|nr:hypothetical protein LFAB_07965 [Lactiplantibacillus fabifermentans T30PCM01]
MEVAVQVVLNTVVFPTFTAPTSLKIGGLCQASK